MPCILKQKTKSSPGIISFTNNEVLAGVPHRSKRVKRFLEDATKNGEWISGVHIQGYVRFVDKWPLDPWQSYILWTETDDTYLREVPKDMILGMNCVNFMPEIPTPSTSEKPLDLIVVAHATRFKRIYEILHMIRMVMDARPNLRVTIIVPDQRNLEQGESTYKIRDIDRRFFELPMQLFTAKEFKNISFVSSSTDAFGKFPLAADLVQDLMQKSKILISFSPVEGTPRVFAEALMSGTVCAIYENTYFGMKRVHNEKNTIWLPNDVPGAAQKLIQGLEQYDRFNIDHEAVRNAFSEKRNLHHLKNFFTEILQKHGHSVDGEWYLDDLHLRLPCHGEKINHQFLYNEDLFFNWIENVQKYHPYDEDKVLGLPPLNDEKSLYIKGQEWTNKFKAKLSGVRRKLMTS